jgi:predicted TIM-barrel enzyme
MGPILDACLRDAERLVAGGMHGLVVENHGDVPFAKPEDLGPETAACLAVIAERVRAATGVPLGINVLANAPLHASRWPRPRAPPSSA